MWDRIMLQPHGKNTSMKQPQASLVMIQSWSSTVPRVFEAYIYIFVHFQTFINKGHKMCRTHHVICGETWGHQFNVF